MDRKRRLLIIAFPDSIHTARWIGQLDRSKYEVFLFPSVVFKALHPAITDITYFGKKEKRSDILYVPLETMPLNLIRSFTSDSLFRRIVYKIGAEKYLRTQLKKATGLYKFDYIHTMESQQAGYLYSGLSKQNNIPWIHSTWGIDLHYFHKDPGHVGRLTKMLSEIDLLITEGDRDINLAYLLGFKNKATIIPSVGGGFDFSRLDDLRSNKLPSERKKIVLKGYEGHERLASNALLALQKIGPQLQGFEVIVYSCNNKLMPLINGISNSGAFSIKSFKETDYDTLIKLVAESRISITNNLSDGVPNTMLEAMALGSFPIQSNTAITEDWIDNGKNGFVTDPLNIDQIAESISKAISDDHLVDSAALINSKKVREKLNIKKVKQEIDAIYAGIPIAR